MGKAGNQISNTLLSLTSVYVAPLYKRKVLYTEQPVPRSLPNLGCLYFLKALTAHIVRVLSTRSDGRVLTAVRND